MIKCLGTIVGSFDLRADLLKKYDRIALVDVYTDIAMPWIVVDRTATVALPGDRIVPTSVLQPQDQEFLNGMMAELEAIFLDAIGSKSVVLEDSQQANLVSEQDRGAASVYSFHPYGHQAISPFGKKSKKRLDLSAPIQKLRLNGIPVYTKKPYKKQVKKLCLSLGVDAIATIRVQFFRHTRLYAGVWIDVYNKKGKRVLNYYRIVGDQSDVVTPVAGLNHLFKQSFNARVSIHPFDFMTLQEPRSRESFQMAQRALVKTLSESE